MTKIDFSEHPFKVWIEDQTYPSNTVIISTGASAKYLGLESEKKFLGRGLSACATCDGAFFRDVNVCVIGGGDTAMEEAIFLTRFAKKVYLIHRRDTFRASKIMAEKAMNHEKIEILWNTELKEVTGDKEVTGVKLYNNKRKENMDMPTGGVFIAIGHKPNTNIFKGHLEMNGLGYLTTKADSTYTSIEGIFAAGDVQDHIYRQAVTAAGTGCMSAIDAERWLESKGFST